MGTRLMSESPITRNRALQLLSEVLLPLPSCLLTQIQQSPLHVVLQLAAAVRKDMTVQTLQTLTAFFSSRLHDW